MLAQLMDASSSGVGRLRAFVQKPELRAAKAKVTQVGLLWASGMMRSGDCIGAARMRNRQYYNGAFATDPRGYHHPGCPF